MPVYNTDEEYLRAAIESILNQTFEDFELLILNDGSTNNAEEVILSYKDERIKYYKSENCGIANTLNKGMLLASGEYIARMDSDDISLPQRFEKQLKYFEKNNDISICGSWIKQIPDKKIIKHKEKIKYLDLLKGCYIAHPTVMFKRDIFLKSNLFYNPQFKCEDYELWSRAIRFLNFGNVQEVLLKYRIHENNLSKPTERFLADVEKTQRAMLDYLSDNNDLLKLINFANKKIEKNKLFVWKIKRGLIWK